MAEDGLVDGEGWISDESSFYGDEDIKWKLKKKVKSALKRPLQEASLAVVKKQKHSGEFKATAKKKSKPEQSTQDFLRSRPQIVRMQKEASPRQSAIKTLPEIHVVDQDPKVLLQSNGLRNSATLQPDETVDHFLKRLPVADPETANTGPWLWVHDRDRNKHHDRSDTDSFKDQGEALLNAFVKQRSTIEAQHPGMAPAGITRKMAPYRDQLVDDLRSAAVDSGVTCGKWMLFPKSADLPRCWRIVAEATSHGKLGPTSKVGTYDPYDTKDETLICVYTHDFTDVEDVRRVLDELLALNLCRSEGKRIYYKCDAYTYLNIKSDNIYKIKASLYSSIEMFKDMMTAKTMANASTSRASQQRTQPADSFFST